MLLEGPDLAAAIRAELKARPETYEVLRLSPEQCARARWLLGPYMLRADLRLVTRCDYRAISTPHR